MAADLTRITDYLLGQSWQIAILVLLILAVNLMLKSKSAHVRYLLWLIVLAKCLVPPLYSIPLAVLPKPDVCEPTQVSAETEPITLEPQTPNTASAESARLSLARSELPTLPIAGAVRQRISLWQWAGIAWVLGAGGFLVFNLLRAVRANLCLWKRREALPAKLRSDLENLFRAHGIKDFPTVWLADGFNQPFVWGLLRGSIYLPVDFLKINQPKHQRSVLAHELSHVLRFDAAVNILQVVAQAIFWFHPFVWWANRKIRQEREKCCDEMAIALLSDLPGDYGTAILATLAARDESIRPVPSLAVAGPVKNVEERIKTIMKAEKRFYRRPSVIAATAVLLMAILTVPTALVLTARAATQPASERQPKPTNPLHQAAVDGNIEEVKSLIAKGADVNAKIGHGDWMPLHVAARYGHKDICELLILNGADVNKKARHGQTPLLYATRYGHSDAVELLIDKGSDVNARSITEGTPLYRAAAGGYEDLAELLMSEGADANTALLWASGMGHLDATKLLLDKGASVDAKDENGLTPLHQAARYCHMNVAELLIARGADVNTRDNDGAAPAYAPAGGAMFFHRQQVVGTINLLLARGADVDIHLAAFSGDVDKVKSFLEEGIDIDAKIMTQSGGRNNVLTPLCMAVISGQKEVVRFLIDRGADVNAEVGLEHQSNCGALGFALIYPDYSVVRLLVDHGANVEVEGPGFVNKPLSMLFMAAMIRGRDVFEQPDLEIGLSDEKSNVMIWQEAAEASARAHTQAFWPKVRDIVELLLARGADANTNIYMSTPLLNHFARAGLEDAVELLITHGADVNVRERDGTTALAIAKEEGNEEIIGLLRKHGARE